MGSTRMRHLGGLHELLHDCTVAIRVPNGSQATGFFVAPGLVLTCADAVKAAQKGDISIEVIWHGMTTTAQIQEFRDVSYPNLALLQVKLPDHPCVLLYGEAEPFGELYSYGFPDSRSPGKATNLLCGDWRDDRRESLELEAGQVQPGMNGSPLLNRETGCVCGIAQIVGDRTVDQGGRVVLAKVAFRAFPGLVV